MSFLNYNFGAADWGVFSSMLIISALIAIINGIITRRKAHQAEEFLMGSRAVPLIPTSVSLMASFISSITILGYPADVYVLGIQYVFTPAGWMLGGVLILLFIVPLLYPLGMTSIYEYFERRYKSVIVRRLCAAIGILHQNVYVGMCIFGPATALEAMIGFEAYKSVLIIGFLATIPTAIGGLKGVIWMDFFQGIVMYGAMIAILVAGAADVGGFSHACATFRKYNFHITNEATLSKFTWYGAMFGGAFTWLGHMGVSQAGFQRYGALKNICFSRAGVILGLLIQASVTTLAILCGVIVYAYFAGRGCDPIGEGLLTSLNHLIPAIVQEVLNYPGVPGLFMASVFSGAYSSVTSSLTAISANMWEDALQNCFSQSSRFVQAIVIRVVILVAGVIGMAVAFGCIFAGGSIIQLALAFINAVTGPVVGCFILSAVFPMANHIGAVVGTLTALAFTLWTSVGAYVHVIKKVSLPPVADMQCNLTGFIENLNGTSSTTYNYTVTTATSELPSPGVLSGLYEISYVWYGIFAAAIVLIAGIIVSLATHTCVEKLYVEKRYLFPLIRNINSRYIIPDQEDEKDIHDIHPNGLIHMSLENVGQDDPDIKVYSHTPLY